jgi:hypothetical protein
MLAGTESTTHRVLCKYTVAQCGTVAVISCECTHTHYTLSSQLFADYVSSVAGLLEAAAVSTAGTTAGEQASARQMTRQMQDTFIRLVDAVNAIVHAQLEQGSWWKGSKVVSVRASNMDTLTASTGERGWCMCTPTYMGLIHHRSELIPTTAA